MKTDAVAGAATGARGLVIRPYAGEADLPAVARIQNAAMAADGIREHVSVDDLRAWWGNPSEQFDPARDATLVEAGGRAVAVTQRDWVDATDGVREYRSRGWIAPEYRRRGIGTLLLSRNEAASRSLAGSHATERPRFLGVSSAEANVGATALARAFGYEPARWFADMERSLTDELPEVPPLPDGIEVRPASASQARAIWEADHDAFQDHWGGWDSSEAGFRRWIESPDFQPELFVVAWDGDEIAGAVLNAIYPEENATLGVARGWLDSVFTRRPWRRRGLARALIVRSLHVLRARGMDVGVLGVDADNPTGAFGLYESVGFEARERFIAWRKPLEEGT